MKKKKIIILGAGITGLVAGYYLSKENDVTLIEKENYLGGTATSFSHEDFILDYGPHKIYTEIPGIIEEINKLTPLLKVKKKNSIYLKGSYFDFPLKFFQIAIKMPFTAFSAGLDILFKPFVKKSEDSYENYLTNRFGKTMYNLSFRDYAFKVWNTPPDKLDKELAKRRVAVSSIFQLIKGILFRDTRAISADYFYYPPLGIKEMIESIKKRIILNGGKIILNSEISSIKFNEKKCDYIVLNKKRMSADYYISTIPLDSLVELSNLNFNKLNYQSLNIHYFILNKKKALKDCWIFFPEKKFIFQRVSEQKSFSPFTSPLDKTAIMVETTKPSTKENISLMIGQLESAGILKRNEIISHFVKTLHKSYPVYKKGFFTEFKKISDFFDRKEGFYLLGRQGLFNYNNMDQCWDMGIKISEQIKNNKSYEDWQNTKKYFDSYRIVD